MNLIRFSLLGFFAFALSQLGTHPSRGLQEPDQFLTAHFFVTNSLISSEIPRSLLSSSSGKIPICSLGFFLISDTCLFSRTRLSYKCCGPGCLWPTPGESQILYVKYKENFLLQLPQVMKFITYIREFISISSPLHQGFYGISFIYPSYSWDW